MALIVRDEADVIVRCLASFADHVDVVAVVDTGSRDGTVDVVRGFFAGRSGPELRLGVFEWRDDFAAARTAADGLLGDCDWLSWVDADDVIQGADQLRPLAAAAPWWLAAYLAHYDCGPDVRGLRIAPDMPMEGWRERLVRAGVGQWRGRVHEVQEIDGPTFAVEPELLAWRHCKSDSAAVASLERNLRILSAWIEDEPHNPTVLRHLWRAELIRGRPRRAMSWVRRYLREDPPWDDERALVYHELAVTLATLGSPELAAKVAREAVRELPDDPLGHLTLSELAGTPLQSRGTPSAG